MKAISVFGLGYLAPFFYDINTNDYQNYSQMSSPRIVEIRYLDRIRNLLDKYGYNVPIVDICSGNEYKENVEYRKVLENGKHFSR